MMLKNGGATGQDLLDRVELANSLMFLTRGQPVVYYGDEQGFIGSGGDKDARQDLFATKVDAVRRRAGHRPAPSGQQGPLRHQRRRCTSRSRSSSALRAANPALADGAQIHRYASDGAGIFAVSRVDARDQVEYLVVANNATTAKSGELRDLQRRGWRFSPLYGAGRTAAVRPGRPGRRSPSPPLSVSVWKARSGDRQAQGRTGGPPHLAAARRCRRWPRRDRRGDPRERLRPGHLRLPAGGHDGVDSARHRRQRAVPGVPGRHRRSPRARCSSTAPSPRTAAGNVSADLVVRHRR